MTWIVGEATGYGYAVAVSDSRITDANGEISGIGVQKTYQVGRSLAAGFAGSVEIGFALIGELRKVVAQSQRTFWLRCEVKDLAPKMKTVFHTYDRNQPGARCHLVVAGTRPR